MKRKTPPSKPARRSTFAARSLEALAEARMVRVRSGRQHRFTGIWVVVVRGRVFARSWNDKPTGWRAAFRENPRGAIRWAARAIAVRVRPIRGERLLDEIERAYVHKYDTPANRKWVRGFRVAWRRETTVEFLPRG
jgi:hypothetical protein